MARIVIGANTVNFSVFQEKQLFIRENNQFSKAKSVQVKMTIDFPHFYSVIFLGRGGERDLQS